MKYQIDEYQLDTDRSELRLKDKLCQIEPQIYLLLEILVQNNDRIVSKQEVIDHVWDGRIVSDASINNRISGARDAIGDDGKNQRKIKTFQSRGFRFVGDVSRLTERNLNSTQKIDPVSKPGFQVRNWKIAGFIAAVTLTAFMFIPGFVKQLRPDPLILPPANSPEKPLVNTSLAVLPFQDMGKGGIDQFLGNGIAAELQNVLSSMPDLKVASRTSSFALYDRKASIQEIGEALNVQYVVEGSVRLGETNLRVTTQLIDVVSDKPIWSKTYGKDYSAVNLLAIQDDVASEVASNLSSELGIPAIQFAHRIDSTEAYKSYLNGKKLAAERDEKSLALAKAALNRTIELEPDYVPAYAALIDVISSQIYYSALPAKEAMVQMEQLLATAKSFETQNADLLVAEAIMHKIDGKDHLALEDYEKALQLNPNLANAWAGLGGVFWNLGHFEDGVAAYEAAHALDPISSEIAANLSLIKLAVGEVDGAQKVANDNLRWHPTSNTAQFVMARINLYQADYETAHKRLMNTAKVSATPYHIQRAISDIYADIGMGTEALAITNRVDTSTHIKGVLGQCDGIMETYKANSRDNDIAFANYMCGDFSEIYPWFRYIVSTYGYGDPDTMIGADQMVKTAIFIDVLNKNNDPDGELMLGKLGRYYKDKSPGDFDLSEQIIGGAAFHMLSGNPNLAMEWFDNLIERGFPFTNLTRYQLFAPLLENPEFEKRQKGFERNAAEIRTIVELQLSEDL